MAPVEVVRIVTVKESNLQFSVRAPKIVPAERQVKEMFPLRNSVFLTWVQVIFLQDISN
jgi:hypothetical protein